MNPNRHVVIPLDFVDELQGLVEVPHGELANFAVNPYNGRLVFAWQDNPAARFYIRLILDQLAGMPDLFDPQPDPPAYFGLDMLKGSCNACRV